MEGSVYLRNSIVHNRARAADCDGGLRQSKGNLSPDGSCAVRASADSRLGELTGSPAYHPLLDGSPAVDAALSEFCPDSDQIGTPRPYGGGCDTGAIESTTAIPAEPTAAPVVCSLYDQVVAANTDRAQGACPAGKGDDTITLNADVTLSFPLPAITSNLTIEGKGHTISGDRKYRVFELRGGRLTLNNLTVRDGRTDQNEQGAAIRVGSGGRLIVNNSSFINNKAGGSGGAIWLEFDSHSLTINNSQFIGNQSTNSGSAIGSVLAYDRSISIKNSSFVDNGGLYNDGAISAQNDVILTISNSTFSNNQDFAGGSALQVSDRAKVTLTHLTLLDNHTTTTGSSIARGKGNRGWLRLRNSIIAGSDSDPHCPERLTENSGNLFADGSCASSVSGDPLLDALSGAPGYHALLDGSPAIDAADPRYCLEADQIGARRPQGGGCDIGALESPDGSAAQIESPAADEASANCIVTTTHTLNFRDRPSLAGARIGLVWQGATLAAAGQTAGWFNVEYQGASGWISAEFVLTQGVCG
jgi:hypothetical protein